MPAKPSRSDPEGHNSPLLPLRWHPCRMVGNQFEAITGHLQALSYAGGYFFPLPASPAPTHDRLTAGCPLQGTPGRLPDTNHGSAGRSVRRLGVERQRTDRRRCEGSFPGTFHFEGVGTTQGMASARGDSSQNGSACTLMSFGRRSPAGLAFPSGGPANPVGFLFELLGGRLPVSVGGGS